ncbi:hypothetical protein AVEN_23579-1 [Araneus ventricosus]|uniref:Uncharacterized protein n=1 Tax=Araneus ventricosus TaxID=182803 RepID=A0A4Y2LBQ3_ARAVE|nr:hypothetical protein AVEN_23579-1 [Araneus ventricosus]
MSKRNSFSISLCKNIETVFKIPNPNPVEGDSPAKDLDVSSTRSQKIPTESLSKVAGVSSVELLINQIIDFNLEPDVSENLISLLQELIKIYANKFRDIKAGVRDSIVDKVITPFIKLFKDRETAHLTTIFDLKSRHIDITERQYQAKIRDCESTIESLKGKLSIINIELVEYKHDFKESSKSLIETTKQVKSFITRAAATFSEVTSRPVMARASVLAQRDNHVLLLRPKKESTSEDNRKRIETALTTRNSPARISRISKVSRGGLIIEAPTPDDLQALEAEIKCVPTLEAHFYISKPKRCRQQIILIGV